MAYGEFIDDSLVICGGLDMKVINFSIYLAGKNIPTYLVLCTNFSL